MKNRFFAFLLATFLFLPAVALAQQVYTWNNPSGGSWGTATNWTPNGIPSAGDKAVFNNGGTYTVNSVPNTSIGAIEVDNNTQPTFTATADNIVTLTGFGSGLGNALNINSGTLTLGGSNAITLSIQTGNTGKIAGTLRFQGTLPGTPHRLLSADPGSVVFENGSQMIAATGFNGNAFGTTNLNSIIFQNGSTYRSQSGGNPFGAAQPNSVVIFQSGSTYRHEQTAFPATSGRTYANFVMDNTSFNASIGGGSVLTVDSLIVEAGNLTINGTGGINIRGNLVVNGGSLTIGTSTTTPVTFNGTSPQAIRGSGGTLTFGANAPVTLNNAAGLTLQRSITLQNALTLTNGLLTTNGNLTLAASASVAGGNDNSYVVGSLSRVFNTTLTTRVYPFGSSGRYRPISIRGNTSSGTATMSGALFEQDANLRESITDPPNRVSKLRYYGFQVTGTSIAIDQVPLLRANVDDGVGSFLSNTSLRVATARTGTGWTLRNLDSPPPNTTAFPVDLSSETGLAFTANVAPDSALFALGSTSNTDNPLPVELLAYTGESTFEGAVLQWQTASEVDNLGFAIWKDGIELASFSNTPSLRGRGTTTEETRYRFVDSKVKVGDVHQYQLRQTDLNGTVHDLGTVTLTITTAVAPREYSLSQNYPNPFNPTTVITYSLKESGEVRLELFDVLGRKVATLVNARQEAGSYTYSFNAARYGLSTGMYFYRLQSGGFVATKKMLLVK
jgi:hypothetical protein